MNRAFSEWLDLLGTAKVGHMPDPVAGFNFLALLYRLGAWKSGDFIVDIGSGNGLYAVPLASERVRYVGVEPMRECVEFCQRVFAPYDHLRFVHVDLQNEMYNPAGRVRPEELRFPVEDGVADLVILNSVFTHLERMELCRHYLSEVHRVLRPGGRAWVTWFRHPPNELSADAGRTVFPEWEIMDALRPFSIRYTAGGLTTGFHDQWWMVVQK